MALAWTMSTRELIISFQADKFDSWSYQTMKILDQFWVSNEEIDSLIGHINHAEMVITLSWHFLSRIRRLVSKFSGYHCIKLTPKIEADIKIWL